MRFCSNWPFLLFIRYRRASKQPLRTEKNATSSVEKDNTTLSVKDDDAKNDNTTSSVKDDDAASSVKSDKEESADVVIEEVAKSIPAEPSQSTFPPFILAHDGPRGLLYAVQAFLGYLLMLSVMCVISASRLYLIANTYVILGPFKSHICSAFWRD